MLQEDVDDKLDAALELVRLGVVDVREDGTVWRSARSDGYGGYSPLKRPWRLRGVTRDGYLVMSVKVKGVRRTVYQHRLVFAHFMGPMPQNRRVLHVNGKRTDNRPENLQLA